MTPDEKKPALGAILLTAILLVACAKGPESESTAASDTPKVESAEVSVAAVVNPEMQVGKRVFSSCASCHTTNAGGVSTIGPNLSGVLGSEAGSKQDFTYSDALTSSEIVWTEETLDTYIEDPAAIIPGGTMAFPGVKDEAEREAVVAYLIMRTADDTDPSVPSDQGEDVAVWE